MSVGGTGFFMREYEYYLFENFDADKEVGNPDNPRNFLGKQTDALLSEVANHLSGDCLYSVCCEKYGSELVHKLRDEGILRQEGKKLYFDCPIFLREDSEVLHKEVSVRAKRMVDLLVQILPQLNSCCEKLNNGFSVQLNLYHILCGMVFDGYLFDYLSSAGALATSRIHNSGLDYLAVIYERCNELQSLSNGLLCSYNRLVNEQCSLQSFGDAQGDRFDFYRLFRLLEKKNVPEKFLNANILLGHAVGEADKDALLAQVALLVKTGVCDPSVVKLMEHFGYMQNGTICVPVYTREDRSIIMEIEYLVEECIGSAMADTLMDLANDIDITAVRHGVNRLEIANELYHIVFGSVNEELVARKIVSVPQNLPKEGRYFKCIELY